MSTRPQRIGAPVLVLITLLCPLGSSGLAGEARPDADAHTTAKQILDSTAIKGGLVVHLGCGDGKLTAALRAKDRYLVHGLDQDPDNVQQARDYIKSLGLYGPVSIDHCSAGKLPYADNLVNLVVASGECQMASEEIARVLAPGGIALVKQNLVFPDTRHLTPDTSPALPSWTKLTKPRPADIDEWTHYLHGPDNNTVAQDTVAGPPRHFQWISGPRFSRSHDHLASVSAVVSSGGRLFSIVDTGSIAFAGASPRWRLIARDAFNGVVLWEREISPWEYHLRDFRSGPADIARRLVAVGDRVYVTLGYGQPTVALDAATGETVRTFADTEGTQEILFYNDMLLLALGTRKSGWRAQKAKEIVSQQDYSPPFEEYTPPVHEMRVMAVDAKTGELVWRSAQPYTRELMPSTLAASAGRVYFQNADAVICLDATSGELEWKTPRPAQRQRLAWSTPTLVVHDGVVFSADRKAAEKEGEVLWIPSGGYHEYIRGEDVKGELIAFDGETGERLWSCPAYEGFNAPVDVMIVDGLVWTGRYAWGQDPGITEARDPRTGEVRRQRPRDQEFLPPIGHARCYRAKATAKYVILGRRGVEFIDVETGNMVANRWLRGICQYGVMPANGLLYIPPHSCACQVTDMLKSGFVALAPAQKSKGQDVEESKSEKETRLVKGPAYGQIGNRQSAIENPNDWPTYRHDASRSGVAQVGVSHDLKSAWETDLGGRLTSPVVAEGFLLVGETDTHHVHALDATTGREAWTFATGARIDSAPTIHQGRVLFGSADGRVYCLRLEDGELIWKFRAAPQDRRIVVDGQLESAWPVSGTVLVVDGAAYFAGGRTSYLDGGMFLCKLDVATGRTLKFLELTVEEKIRNGGVASGGHLPDVLTTDGDSIFMRSARFDMDLVRQKDNVAHLWSSIGLLDDSWWHRTYWQIGISMGSGWGGWAKAGQRGHAGRLLVSDGSRVFGYGRNQYDIPGAHVGVDAGGVWGPIGAQQGRWTFYQLFGRAMDTRAGKPSPRKPAPAKQAASESDWARRVPVLGQALVLANETLFVAGPVDEVSEIPHEPTGSDPLAEALEAQRGGRLLAVSATDGKTLADYELTSSPVFDGMAAAQGRLYLSTKSGKVVCMSPVQ
ncbi:MAG: PQQ-binding-like beta-propeller repeat protein [Pirellulaceae bacterium]|nr:PQQ-binding-like beta-propeller repeat protein [Pirellulaceae bacterium]